MAAKRSSHGRKYGKAASKRVERVESVMRRKKTGGRKSGGRKSSRGHRVVD